MAFNFNNFNPKHINIIKDNAIKHTARVIVNGVVVWLEKVLTKLTGYPITLTNSTGDDLLDYKIYGESVQKFDASNMTNIWDGTYTTGTYYDTNGNLVELSSIAMSNMMELKYKKYNITCINLGTIMYNFRFNYFDENKNWLSQTVIGVNVSDTVVQEIEVPNGAKYINFSVMNNIINAGHKICPSSNNVPTPIAPIEIESVGDKTSNFFKIPEKSSASVEVLKNGLKSLANQRCTIMMTIPDLEVGKTYTCKVNVKAPEGSAGTAGQIIYTDGTNNLYLRNAVLSESVRTFTLKEGVEYNQLWLYGKDVEYLDIMIVEGEYTVNNFPDYEPYGYRIPITVSGENLFDMQYALVVGNWVKRGGYQYIPANLEAGKTYFITSENLTTDANLISLRFGTYDGSNYKSLMDILSTSTKTLSKKEVTFIADGTECFYAYSNGGVKTDKLDKLFNEYTTGIRIYEEGLEPRTTNIYLKEPLRRIGDYADYIDFENQKVVRNIIEKRIEKINSLQSINGNGIANFQFVTSDYKTGVTSLCLCNRFKSSIKAIANETEQTIYIYLGESRASYLRIKSEIASTVTEMNEWLSNNETIYTYPLETPKEEDITLPNIPTIKGTTIIEIDTTIQPSNMEVQYYGKEV